MSESMGAEARHKQIQQSGLIEVLVKNDTENDV